MGQTIRFPATDDTTALRRKVRHEMKTIHAVYQELHRCIFERKQDIESAEQLSSLALAKLKALIEALERDSSTEATHGEAVDVTPSSPIVRSSKTVI